LFSQFHHPDLSPVGLSPTTGGSRVAGLGNDEIDFVVNSSISCSLAIVIDWGQDLKSSFFCFTWLSLLG